MRIILLANCVFKQQKQQLNLNTRFNHLEVWSLGCAWLFLGYHLRAAFLACPALPQIMRMLKWKIKTNVQTCIHTAVTCFAAALVNRASLPAIISLSYIGIWVILNMDVFLWDNRERWIQSWEQLHGNHVHDQRIIIRRKYSLLTRFGLILSSC